MERIEVRTAERECMLDITASVREALARSGASEGIAVAFVPHTTAALTINENADPDVAVDMLAHLAKLVPADPAFRHAEGNADAHIKASLVGSSVAIIVEGGAPKLGRWQGIFFCEFDGPRTREVWVQTSDGRTGGSV